MFSDVGCYDNFNFGGDFNELVGVGGVWFVGCYGFYSFFEPGYLGWWEEYSRGCGFGLFG